jgi:YVTN family beta-propeller protein
MKLRTTLAALALAAGFVTQAAAQPLYHLVKTVPLGGSVTWDYLHFDAPSHRLYISHGNQVTVVDTSTDKIVGRLAGLPGSHGIAVDPVTGNVYADSRKKNVAIAFNAKTFAPIAAIPVAAGADGMQYDPASGQVFVGNGDSAALTPIDAATNKASADIRLGGAPEFFAPDGASALYVNISDKNALLRIDTATDKVTARWPATGCAVPTGLAIDTAKHLVFSSCRSGVMDVFDTDTGAVIASLPIGEGTDAAAYDPVRHRAFSANADGTLTVIGDIAAPRVLAVVKTAPGARTLAVDPASGDIFTVTGTVTKIVQATTPYGRPHFPFVPGSLKLLVYAPSA